MLDAITAQPIRVHGEPLTGSHVVVPETQLDVVADALRHGGVTFWVADEAITIRDEPPVVFVTLSRSSDRARVQAILDQL